MISIQPNTRRRAIGALAAAPLAALAAGLGACVDDHQALTLSRPETRHQIAYSSRTEALLVEVPAGAHGLSPNQEADVWQFISRYKAESNGTLRLSTPSSSRRHSAVYASLDDVREIAREIGVPPARIVVGRHTAGARSGTAVKIAYDRPVALPPDCADWSEDVGRTRERLHYPNFGCASQRNLALNVANARDLQRPQEEQPSSAERMSVNWTKYVNAGAATSTTSPAQPSTTDTKPTKPTKQ